MICQSLQGVPLWTGGASYQILETVSKKCEGSFDYEKMQKNEQGVIQ